MTRITMLSKNEHLSRGSSFHEVKEQVFGFVSNIQVGIIQLISWSTNSAYTGDVP